MIYLELCIELFSIVLFYNDVEDWHDQSVLTFRLGGVAHLCNVVELGRRLEIYSLIEVEFPPFVPYVDSCIHSQPQGYSYMAIWVLARNDYVTREAKDSSF